MILLAAGLTMMLSAAAQPGGEFPPKPERHAFKERPTVKEEAQRKTDQMVTELSLSQKQIKKLSKFNQRDIQYRRDHFELGGPRPDGNFPAPPAGGFPGGPGGKGPRPAGGPGMGPGNPPAGMPPMKAGIDYNALDKYNARQDKKLRKIIGDDNFRKWRDSHPLELPKLPEPIR